MDKYEYRIEKSPYGYWFKYPKEKVTTWLNELGDEGWELVTILPYYIFKRNIGK